MNFETINSSQNREAIQSLMRDSGIPNTALTSQSDEGKLLQEFSNIMDKIAAFLTSQRKNSGKTGQYLGAFPSDTFASQGAALSPAIHLITQTKVSEEARSVNSTSQSSQGSSEAAQAPTTKKAADSENKKSDSETSSSAEASSAAAAQAQSVKDPARQIESSHKDGAQKDVQKDKDSKNQEQKDAQTSSQESAPQTESAEASGQDLKSLAKEGSASAEGTLMNLFLQAKKAEAGKTASQTDGTSQADIAAVAFQLVSNMLQGEKALAQPQQQDPIQNLLGAKSVDAAKSIQSTSSVGSTMNGRGDALFFKAPESNSQADNKLIKSPAPRMIPPRTLEHIENALKEAARSKDGSVITLRLTPNELGPVKVDVSLKDGVLHARLVANSPEVNNFLREKSLDLQQTLRKLGLNVEEVRISVSSESTPMSDGNGFSGQEKSMQGAETPQTSGAAMIMGADGSAVAPAMTQGVYDHWVA